MIEIYLRAHATQSMDNDYSRDVTRSSVLLYLTPVAMHIDTA